MSEKKLYLNNGILKPPTGIIGSVSISKKNIVRVLHLARRLPRKEKK